jgi:hypothetical protein
MAVTDLNDTIVRRHPSNWPSPGEMHFRLVDSLLGTLDLSCDSGYVVRSYELGSPEMREVTYANSLDDGNFDVTAFIGPRAVTLDMVLRNTPGINGTGTPTQSESQMRDAILRYLSPLRRPSLFFSEHGDTYVDALGQEWSRVRYLTLRGQDAPISVSRPQFNELSMSWVAPTGLIENFDYHQAVIQFTEEDLDAEYRIHTNNMGSHAAWWTLTIDGDLESPQIELDGRLRLWLNYHIEEPNTIVIDSRTKTVKIGNNFVGYRYLDDRSDWFRIPPGNHVITLTHKSVQRSGLPYARWEPLNTTVPAPAGITAWVKLTIDDVEDNPDFILNFNPDAFADLFTLKNDLTHGDRKYYGHEFQPGDYILLADNSQAWFDGVPRAGSTAPDSTGVWAAGHRPITSTTDRYIWTPSIDDATGEPVRSQVSLTYSEMYL